MTEQSPKLDGVEATFRHVDDIDWTVVQQQRNADGTVSVVREKWPIIRPGFLSAYVHYEPLWRLFSPCRGQGVRGPRLHALGD